MPKKMMDKQEQAQERTRSASAAARRAFEQLWAKNYGEGTLVRHEEVVAYDVISTGSILLDYAMGCGGYIEGRLTELWGPDGMGKSTLAAIAVAEAQRKYDSLDTAYIDMEQRVDLAWFQAHGVDLKRMYHAMPDNAEQVADQLKDCLRSGLFSMVVLDSIGAMIPKKAIDKDADEAVVAGAAAVVTRMCQIATVEARKNKVAVLLLNQVRVEGIGGSFTYDGTPGGKALRHSTTHKIKIGKGPKDPYTIGSGAEVEVVGEEIVARVDRNGVAPRGRVAYIGLMNQETDKYGPIGIDKAGEAFTLGKRFGLIEQHGGYWVFTTDGEQVQGNEGALGKLRNDPTLVDQIRVRALETRAHELHEERFDNGDGEVPSNGQSKFPGVPQS